jgi:hypothetical protein
LQAPAELAEERDCVRIGGRSLRVRHDGCESPVEVEAKEDARGRNAEETLVE